MSKLSVLVRLVRRHKWTCAVLAAAAARSVLVYADCEYACKVVNRKYYTGDNGSYYFKPSCGLEQYCKNGGGTPSFNEIDVEIHQANYPPICEVVAPMSYEASGPGSHNVAIWDISPFPETCDEHLAGYL